MKRLIVAVVIAASLAACTNAGDAIRVLYGAGYTNVEITGTVSSDAVKMIRYTRDSKQRVRLVERYQE